MVDLSEARLTTLVVHKVGNKVKNEGVVTAEDVYPLEEGNSLILQDYFLSPFKGDEYFKFTHESDLSMNELNTYSKQLFTQSKSEFLSISTNILRHLYTQSIHPHIKGGELYVAHFRECVVDGVEVEAIGIFKSENKDVFLKFSDIKDEVGMMPQLGVHTKNLDKGCLIFNTFADDGFSILMVNKSSEDTQYWRDDFLHVERIQDNSFRTEGVMTMTKDFCEEIIAKENDKKEQVLFLNKSLNYFSQNADFDVEEFKEEVFESPADRAQFDEYRTSYESQMGLPPTEENFPISKYAVRAMKKDFKNLIKLDTQLEIRFNGRNIEEVSDYLHRGFDEQRGMYYYKLYFHEEM